MYSPTTGTGVAGGSVGSMNGVAVSSGAGVAVAETVGTSVCGTGVEFEPVCFAGLPLQAERVRAEPSANAAANAAASVRFAWVRRA